MLEPPSTPTTAPSTLTALPTRPIHPRASAPPLPFQPPGAPAPLHIPVRRGFVIRRWRLILTFVAITTTLAIFLGGWSGVAPTGKTGAGGSQPTARVVLERVRQEIVPAENSSTAYGASFNAEGYETLLSWHTKYQVTKPNAASFESLDLTLPCCAFGHPSADETKNCACGHHQALYGLSKRLLAMGYEQKRAQAEVSRWAAYFFPRESLEAVLSQRAASDPAMREALDELRQKGGC